MHTGAQHADTFIVPRTKVIEEQNRLTSARNCLHVSRRRMVEPRWPKLGLNCNLLPFQDKNNLKVSKATTYNVFRSGLDKGKCSTEEGIEKKRARVKLCSLRFSPLFSAQLLSPFLPRVRNT